MVKNIQINNIKNILNIEYNNNNIFQKDKFLWRTCDGFNTCLRRKKSAFNKEAPIISRDGPYKPPALYNSRIGDIQKTFTYQLIIYCFLFYYFFYLFFFLDIYMEVQVQHNLLIVMFFF